MYLPDKFKETDPAVLRRIIREHSFATIFTSDAAGLSANHIPLLLREQVPPHGELAGHIALANPLAKQIAGGLDCLVVFQGPQHYISANWYSEETKAARHAVPTWDYEVVHVFGRAYAVSDPQWVFAQLSELAAKHEAAAAEPRPWKVTDAEPSFVEMLMQHVVGLRIEITSMLGKAKFDQSESPEDRRSVLNTLEKHADVSNKELLDAMRRYCRPS